MQKKVSNLVTFTLTQYLKPEFWNSEMTVLLDALKSADTEHLVGVLVGMLEYNGYNPDGSPTPSGWEVEEAYGIIHDKDTRLIWDEKTLSDVVELKPAHIHLCVKFKKGKNMGANIGSIARSLKVEPQYIEKPKPGRWSWDNQLAYLIHAKDFDKHQYEPEEVITHIGQDYIDIYRENFNRWKKGGVKKQNKQTKEDVDWLESEILQGKVSRSQIFLTDSYYCIYSQNKRRIDDAFDTYGQRKIYKALAEFENGDFRVSVYYVMGESGKGKSTFADHLARQVQVNARNTFNQNWDVYKTAATNPVDNYEGQEIMIMDDARGSAMRADDWLKLLDPWHVSPSSARYQNKTVVSRVIIITATITPVEFFYYAKGVGQGSAQSEAVDQFLRRLLAIVQLINVDDIVGLRPKYLESGYITHSVGKNQHGIQISTPSQIELMEENRWNNSNEAVEFFAQEVIENNMLNNTFHNNIS